MDTAGWHRSKFWWLCTESPRGSDMVDDVRATARDLAAAARARGEPLAWFEELYAQSGTGDGIVPWADLVPNPHLQELIGASSVRKAHAEDPLPRLSWGVGWATTPSGWPNRGGT